MMRYTYKAGITPKDFNNYPQTMHRNLKFCKGKGGEIILFKNLEK